ncbi:hypothetical protein RJ640_023020 [Escallonia rubra]|uniref:Chlororespiratory reduction 4 n=1 Tax=Escallonia rubra TaxID=112253 RepID=A0AA88RB94_9ASTE|nr:hypothetical protein RJ640_023020 [Escallonia rubra]
MEYAKLVFSHLGSNHVTNTTLWSAMIRGYAYNGPFDNCVSMYQEMCQRGLKANNFTYPYVIDGCSVLGWGQTGKAVQCQAVKAGFERAFSVACSVFRFYLKMADFCEVLFIKSKCVNDARKLLDEMSFKEVELWNRLIYGYVSVGDLKCARQVFDEMSERDIVSWNSMISGYARVGDVANARGLFERMSDKNVVSWTLMIGLHADLGDLRAARTFFEDMPERNVVSWNCLISSYTQNGESEEALNLFVRMRMEGVDADGFTFVSALSACSLLGDLEFGKWIHYLVKDWPKLGVIVGTALVEMYAKCGDVNRAFTTFLKIQNKDVFCYNVMIKSLAIHGMTGDAIKIFYSMQKKGLKPNDKTFTAALFACSHGGLVEEGRKIFSSMEKQFGSGLKLEHYGCMVDLLSRNGQVDDAHIMVSKMPFQPDIAIWGALLSGCRVIGDLKLAEHVVEKARDLKASESVIYVLHSNLHASVGQWKEALGARDKMEEKSICKRTGWSAIVPEINLGAGG